MEGEEVEGEEVEVEGEEVELEISSEDEFNAGDSSAVQRSAATAKKARKEFWGSESDSSEDEESSDQEKAEEDGSKESERECEREKAKDSEELLPGTYVVAVYQGAWYLGQVLDKKEERLALRQQEYTYVSFMQRVGGSGDNFKWPEKPDKLNTLREDVLFVCGAPIPAAATSSSRNISFTLSPAENKKAHMLLNKAYYHTFLILGYLIPYFQGPVLCVCVCVYIGVFKCVCAQWYSTGTLPNVQCHVPVCVGINTVLYGINLNAEYGTSSTVSVLVPTLLTIPTIPTVPILNWCDNKIVYRSNE